LQIKIFHYEPTYHFYLRTEVIEDRRPDIGLPAHSTHITPPLDKVRDGEIPIFDGNSWKIVADTFWKPRIRELNYDAKRNSTTYEPLALSMYGNQFSNYPSMPMLCNTALVVQAICQRTRLIHEKFEYILRLHKQVINDTIGIPLESPEYKSLAAHPTILYKYKLEVESIVYLMRRVLDSLVQLSYLLTNYTDFEQTRTIAHNKIGEFLDKQQPTTDLERIITGDGINYERDKTGFLRIINDLFNSFKHCLMHDESYQLVCINTPSVTSYQAKYNKHSNEIIYHNHNAYNIMMGFQDSVIRILNNQKTYVSRHKKV
jgi:hypothetical protein